MSTVEPRMTSERQETEETFEAWYERLRRERGGAAGPLDAMDADATQMLLAAYYDSATPRAVPDEPVMQEFRCIRPDGSVGAWRTPTGGESRDEAVARLRARLPDWRFEARDLYAHPPHAVPASGERAETASEDDVIEVAKRELRRVIRLHRRASDADMAMRAVMKCEAALIHAVREHDSRALAHPPRAGEVREVYALAEKMPHWFACRALLRDNDPDKRDGRCDCDRGKLLDALTAALGRPS